MQTRTLHIGDRIRVDVKGEVFDATIRSLPGRDKGERLVGIDPFNPKRVTRRFCSPRSIREKLPKRGDIRVARGGGELSPETQKLVDEATERGRAGAAAIMSRGRERQERLGVAG